jgi:sensor domain CHASE-containing protein
MIKKFLLMLVAVTVAVAALLKWENNQENERATLRAQAAISTQASRP